MSSLIQLTVNEYPYPLSCFSKSFIRRCTDLENIRGKNLIINGRGEL